MQRTPHWHDCISPGMGLVLSELANSPEFFISLDVGQVKKQRNGLAGHEVLQQVKKIQLAPLMVQSSPLPATLMQLCQKGC